MRTKLRWQILKALGWGLVAASVGILALDFSRFARIGVGNYEKSNLWDYAPDKGSEVIVVLTGDHTRIPRAFELMRKKGSQWLVISGAGRGITLTEVVNQQGDSANLIHALWERIILESRSSSTIENGVESAEIVKQKKPNRVLLVTSDYHMLRASAIFRHLMPDYTVIEYPVSSALLGPTIFTRRFFRLCWIMGLEYWKYQLFLLRRSWGV